MIITTTLFLNLRLKQLCKKYWRILKCINKYRKYTQIFAATKSSKIINIGAFPKYWQIHKILASYEIIGVCLKSWRFMKKYWRLPEILASHENIGLWLKSWRLMKILADTKNIGGCSKYWRLMKILAGIQNIGAW
jgi:hypothetical protein